MPCSFCGQWIDTGVANKLADYMEYEWIREADARDRIFPGCHWWWINFPCRPDDHTWGVVGFLRCEACQLPDDAERTASPRPLQPTEVLRRMLRLAVDRNAGRVHRATSPTDAEAPNCIVGGVPNWGRELVPRHLIPDHCLPNRSTQENWEPDEEDEPSGEPWRNRSHSASSEESVRQIGIINRQRHRTHSASSEESDSQIGFIISRRRRQMPFGWD